MMLEQYATSVVGSYSVPRWYEAFEKQVEAGGKLKAMAGPEQMLR